MVTSVTPICSKSSFDKKIRAAIIFGDSTKIRFKGDKILTIFKRKKPRLLIIKKNINEAVICILKR